MYFKSALISVEKEWGKEDFLSSTPSLAIIIMVKNEERRILTTLNSVLDIADSYIIYDTGSSDKTVEMIKAFCQENNKNLYLLEGQFVDFSTSRNLLLDYADTKGYDFQLLLDCNDEVQTKEEIRQIMKTHLHSDKTAFAVTQKWYTGGSIHNNEIFTNIRLVKRNTNWRFRGIIHEILMNSDCIVFQSSEFVEFCPQIIIFQNRTLDNNKSYNRFSRDLVLLYDAYKKDPTDSRTMFYLAQTYICVGKHEDAAFFYKQRYDLGGFNEEVFHSCLRIADIMLQTKKNWYVILDWYNKALEIMMRAEPLVKIAKYYFDEKKYYLAWMYIAQACQLEFPNRCVLYVDANVYEYKRWYLLAKIGLYCKKKSGIIGCNIGMKVLELRNEKNTEEYEELTNMVKLYEIMDGMMDDEKSIESSVIDYENKINIHTEIKKQIITNVDIDNTDIINEMKKMKEQYPTVPDSILRKRILFNREKDGN